MISASDDANVSHMNKVVAEINTMMKERGKGNRQAELNTSLDIKEAGMLRRPPAPGRGVKDSRLFQGQRPTRVHFWIVLFFFFFFSCFPFAAPQRLSRKLALPVCRVALVARSFRQTADGNPSSFRASLLGPPALPLHPSASFLGPTRLSLSCNQCCDRRCRATAENKIYLYIQIRIQLCICFCYIPNLYFWLLTSNARFSNVCLSTIPFYFFTKTYMQICLKTEMSLTSCSTLVLRFRNTYFLLDSNKLSSIQFNPDQFNSVQVKSTQLNSMQFNSIQ